MKEKLFDYPVAWLSGASASAVSVFAVATQEQAVAIASAVVAVSVVLAQPTMKAIKSLRSTLREEDAKDREADLAAFAAEVRKRVELEAEVADLREGVKAREAEVVKLRKEVERLEAELSSLRKTTNAVNHKVDDVRAAVERVERRSSDSIPVHKEKPK